MVGVQIWSVSTDIDFYLLGPADSRVTVPVQFRYDLADPFAVSAIFHVGEGQSVEWNFARELLAAGTHASSGEGDVRISPLGPLLRMVLTSPSGQAILEGPLTAITAFIERSHAVVPPGREAEMVDLDGELAMLLS